LVEKNNISIEIIDNIKTLFNNNSGNNISNNNNKVMVRIINHQPIIEIPKNLIDKNILLNLKNKANKNNNITFFENNIQNNDNNINSLKGIYELNNINSTNNLIKKHINNKITVDKSKEIINQFLNKKRNNPNILLGNF